MSVSRKAQPGLFYQLSMTIDYTWEDNSCGTNTNVYSETAHKLNIDQHEPLIKKMGLTSGASEG
jgi:hypothetical protein